MKTSLAITSAIAARLRSAVNHKIAIVVILAASLAAASATSFSTTAVGTVNGNNLAFSAATGNSNSFTIFTNDLANAFATNSGGVWNFDGASWSLSSGETVTLSYGASPTNSLVLTFFTGNSDAISQGNPSSPTSGTTELTENGGATDRAFTPSKPLKAVSIFNLSRGDASRTAILTVTYLDNTTATTSGGNGGAVYFHELEANPTNPIVKFTIKNSNLNRYDDMGFIVAPPIPLAVATPTASAGNQVAQGTTNTLSASVLGGTAPYKYQWRTDGGSGGALTNIPNATNATYAVNTTGMTPGVNYSYSLVVTDSVLATASSVPVVLSVYSVFSGTLAATGNVAPTPGSYDISQLTAANGYQSSDGLNYYTDNGQNNNKYCGQTFTTGSNAQGYTLNALAIGLSGGANGSQAANTTYDLFIYKISPDGLTATVIADVTNLMASTIAYPNWVQWNFSGVVLTNNATYGYGFGRRSVGGYLGMATSPGGSDYYSGGQIAAFSRSGGAVVYGNTGYGDTTHDGVFDIGLIPNGIAIILNTPTAAPNPSYALTPVKLADTVALAVSATTYKWLTDDGSGGYSVVPGATGTNLTVIPPDLNPGGADYTTNYYFVATDVLGNSATSSVVTLTIHAATVPLITGPTPTNIVTFVGDSRSMTVTENGTLPITNQWQFDNGGGYVGLTAQTNTTLTLNNLQTTNSGNYRIVASNVVGSSSSAVTLTVLPAPAAPVAASQVYYNAVYTNHPWAYWRLNETNDPTAVDAPTYTAFDYSGHGFDPVYGNAVTVGNAGPQPPTYPSMDTNQLAVKTATYTANAYLTAPALNLTGKTNVTFMAWINPNGGQTPYTGLLFNRGGPDNACGFGFGGTSDHLGYTWNNNSSATWSWDSGLAVADNDWNFVAYVITPTNVMVYLGNLSGGTTNFLQAANNINHAAQTFAGGTVRLGGDPGNVNRTFNGLITEATLFTNALTAAQVQEYFLIGIGAQALPPTIPNLTVTPSDAAGAGVYSGQNVRMSTSPTGTAPLSMQWQAGPDGSTWTNVPNATNSALLINPFTVGTIYYQLVVTNAAGAGSTPAVAITFNALPSYPAGLWTVNFQETNNIGSGQTVGSGVGHYVGRGVLGDGTYWNVLPHVLASGSEYSAGTINSVTDLRDDGMTSSGISCRMNSGGSYNSVGTSLPNTSDVGNLLGQFYRTYFSPSALQFFGVPDGTYNLTCYAGNGVSSQGANNYGSTFAVHAANGNQTNSTAQATHVTDALAEGLNFVTFTNVHVVGGTLNVDVFGNADVGGSAVIEGAQIQLVSYDPVVSVFSGTPTNIFATQSVTFTTASTGTITNWIWSFGDGSSVTNVSNASVNHTYANVGTYTVSLTVRGPAGSDTATRTGYIVALASPTIGSAQMANGEFVLSGSNGPAGQQYRILGTTNLTLPLANWTTLFTGVFAADGSYGYTNSSPTNAASFFRLVSP